MGTLFDVVSVIVFAGLAVLYLQRSASPEPGLKTVYYAPPAIGCALANWLGNQQQGLAAALVIAAVIAYAWFVLKPFSRPG